MAAPAVAALIEVLIQAGRLVLTTTARRYAVRLATRSLLRKSAKRALLRGKQMGIFKNLTQAAVKQSGVPTKIARKTVYDAAKAPRQIPGLLNGQPKSLRRFPPPMPEAMPTPPPMPSPGAPPQPAPTPSGTPSAPNEHNHEGNQKEAVKPEVTEKTNSKSLVTENPSYFPPMGNWLDRAMFHANTVDQMKNAAGRFFPSITWAGTVVCQGYKTTPTRTVVHFALALAFGLIKQARFCDTMLYCEIDHVNNTVHVKYGSSTNPLAEILTIQMFIWTGQASVGQGQAIGQAISQLAQTNTRQLTNPTQLMDAGILQTLKDKAGPLKTLVDIFVKAYRNMARKLGPQAVYDLGEESLYGGYPSALLDYGTILKDQKGVPQPFASFLGKEMLTRRDAPNPQVPGPPAFPDNSLGYSTDLRSLVAQVLYDPGVQPPQPDTNVSLPVLIAG